MTTLTKFDFKAQLTLGSWMDSINWSGRFAIWAHVAKENADLFPSLAKIQEENPDESRIFFRKEDLTDAELGEFVREGNYLFWAAPVGRNNGGLRQDIFTAMRD
jgi:hypothetical protein